MIPDWPKRLAAVGLGLLALCVLPIVYRQHSIAQAERQLLELRRTQQPLPRQLTSVVALAEHGVVQLATGEKLADLREQLEAQMRQCERRIRQFDSSASLSTQRRFEHGLDLFLLDRIPEAEAVLRASAPTHLRSSLLLAVILQDGKRLPESDRWFEHTMTLGATSTDAKVSIVARMQAIDGLASNARHERRFADAVAHYRRGIADLPQARPYFHYQLGRHFAEGGRSTEALAELEIARDLDESQIGNKATKLIEELQRSTPGCVVRNGHLPLAR